MAMKSKTFQDILNLQQQSMMGEMSPEQSMSFTPPAQPEPQAPMIPNETPQEQVFAKPQLSDILPEKPQAPEMADQQQMQVPMLAEAEKPALSKTEQLLQEYRDMIGKDRQSLEEARKRDRMLKIGGALGDALATVINAQGQMNVKAPGVQVQQGAGLGKIAEMFATSPEIASDIKSRQQALLDQYKQMATGELKAADRALKERQVAAYEAQTRAQARKAEANTAKEARKETEVKPSFEEKETIKANIKERLEESKENRKLKKELEPAIATVDEQIKNVKDALNLINKSKVVGTGPLDQYFAGATPEGQLLKKALGNISLDTLVQKFQGMSRAIDTETDRKFFQETQPSMGNFESTNKKMLNDILTRLESVKAKSESKLQEIESEKQPQIEKAQKQQVSNLVRVKGPSGEEATMTEENAKKYLNKPGYTRLK
jgi:hypothetical protein